jgi:peptide/bleomycin uptake transporter
MFKCFFGDKKWWPWSIVGAILILIVTWYKVQLTVEMNSWYGEFYDYIQKILQKPGSSTQGEFFSKVAVFAKLAGIFVAVAVVLEFFVKHWVFRWRTALTNYYVQHWPKLRHIEGASQRVQEDTYRFAKITEGLGVSLMRSIMTLVAFLPILWTLSAKVPELPFIGAVSQSLVWTALMSAIFGTVLLATVGIKLPGLEFNNQKVEAAYRKELVLGEDDPHRASPPALADIWTQVRTNHFRLFFHYGYFDIARIFYLQYSHLMPLIAMSPGLLAGTITLGLMQQISNVFERVESSFQYLVNSWSTIVELISIYNRLRAFEQTIKNTPDEPSSGTGEPVGMSVTL